MAESLGQFMLEHQLDRGGPLEMGLLTAHAWRTDPKHLLFRLARAKFVAKMFQGFDRVLEVGCSDGFAGRLVKDVVTEWYGIDNDPIFVESANNSAISLMDVTKTRLTEMWDGIYALDVLEHISPGDEYLALGNLQYGLKPHGALIIGMPSLESQVYASEVSKMGHVNCKTQAQLRDTMKNYFHSVFMFSMNDEVLHTGYAPMSQYLLALCCDKRD